jgi:PEGA domain
MSFPSSEVVIDGRPKGWTPWQGAAEAGNHQIELETARGKRKTIELTLSDGGTSAT